MVTPSGLQTQNNIRRILFNYELYYTQFAVRRQRTVATAKRKLIDFNLKSKSHENAWATTKSTVNIALCMHSLSSRAALQLENCHLRSTQIDSKTLRIITSNRQNANGIIRRAVFNYIVCRPEQIENIQIVEQTEKRARERTACAHYSARPCICMGNHK